MRSGCRNIYSPSLCMPKKRAKTMHPEYQEQCGGYVYRPGGVVLEDNLEEAAETLCDGYCKYPYVCPDQATLDRICGECKLKKLFEALS